MTYEEVYKAAKDNDYILLRTNWDTFLAINCKIVDMASKRHKVNRHLRSSFQSYRACTFMEYITFKTSFI